jgi:hypothetical protein
MWIFCLVAGLTAAQGAARVALDDNGIGPLRAGMTPTKELLQRAFPGAKVRATAWDGCGEARDGFDVTIGGRPLAHVLPPEVLLLDPRVRTDRGIGVGSTYEALSSAYGPLTCQSELMPWDGSEGFTECFTATSHIRFELEGLAEAGCSAADAATPGCCYIGGWCSEARMRGAKVTKLKLWL